MRPSDKQRGKKMNKVQELTLTKEWSVINNFAIKVAEEFTNKATFLQVELVDPITTKYGEVYSSRANLHSPMRSWKFELFTFMQSIVVVVNYENKKLGQMQLTGITESAALNPVIAFMLEATRPNETETFLPGGII